MIYGFDIEKLKKKEIFDTASERQESQNLMHNLSSGLYQTLQSVATGIVMHC